MEEQLSSFTPLTAIRNNLRGMAGKYLPIELHEERDNEGNTDVERGEELCPELCGEVCSSLCNNF